MYWRRGRESEKVLTGEVVVGTSSEEIRSKMRDGAILVTRSTDKDMMDSFKRASAVIVEQGGLTSHAAVVGLSLGVQVVVGVQKAIWLLQDGMQVMVDSERGHIYSGRANVL